MDDALLRATPLFTVTDKGEVVTKADAAERAQAERGI